MNFHVVENHLRRDEQYLARRNTQVTARAVVVTKLTFVRARAHWPPKRFKAVSPTPTKRTKTVHELEKNIADWKGMLCRKPSDRANMRPFVNLCIRPQVGKVHRLPND